MLKTHRPLRVAVLCSHRAPGLLYLLNRAPDRGATFEIVCVVTSEDTFAEEVRVERRGIPTLVHPIHQFYEARGASNIRDLKVRAAYDAEILKLIEPFFPDLILLDGYLYLVTSALLGAFPGRTINLHFSDLALRRSDGGPQFPGVRAVRDAIAACSAETRATVHLVNEKPDDGAPIVRSWAFPVSPLVGEMRTVTTSGVLNAYAFAHQEWMAETVSGPLLAAALRLIATGAVELHGLGRQRQGANTWLLDHDGILQAPEFEPAGASMLARV